MGWEVSLWVRGAEAFYGAVDLRLIGSGDGEAGTVVFKTCFSNSVTDSGASAEDEDGGLVEFGGVPVGRR